MSKLDFESVQDQALAALPVKLTEFLNTLSESELDELQKIDFHLIAKIYQAGAVFSIDVFGDIARKEKADQ